MNISPIVALAAAVVLGTTELAAQPLADRVEAVRTGTVRFSYPAEPGTCGNGRGNISTGRAKGGTTWVGRQESEWEDECEPGPVRVAIDVSRGTVTAVRAYVGGRWRGSVEADLGEVAPSEASDFLLTVAERGGSAAAKEAIFPATIARGVTLWPRLLMLAKDPARPRAVRESAVFWVSQAASEEATRGLQEIVDDPDGDREVRKSAIFSLSQRSADEAVPALIRIARTNRDPELRRNAIFWLGQSRDPRALAYFEEVLARR